MLLRKSAASDAPALKDIAKRVVTTNYTPFLGADLASAFIESGASDLEIDKGLNHCTVLDLEGQIIGFCITKDDLLHLIMVDVPFQNMGHGSLLLTYAETELLARHSRIQLQTFKENRSAAAFYLKRGWRIASEQWAPEIRKTMLHFEKTRPLISPYIRG